MKKDGLLFHALTIALLILLLIAVLCRCTASQEQSDPTPSGVQTEEQPEEAVRTAYVLVLYSDEDGFVTDRFYVCYPGADRKFPPFSTVHIEYTDSAVRELSGHVTDKDGATFEYDAVIENVHSACRATEDMVLDKPVIYLYPETTTLVDIRLNFDGSLIKTIPLYTNGWTVTAHPDGTIEAADGEEYPYLFWEGVPDRVLQITPEYCVRGRDTEAFLLDILPRMGLIESEYREFIEYWLPRMEGNAYNLISFETKDYEQMAPLTIAPEPDAMLRVFMRYRATDRFVELPAPEIKSFTRHGFTVVEWGGCELK